MDGKTINKVLDWTVKIADVLICAPIKWLVGGELFANVQFTLLRFISNGIHFVSVPTDLEGVFFQLPIQRVKEYAHV